MNKTCCTKPFPHKIVSLQHGNPVDFALWSNETRLVLFTFLKQLKGIFGEFPLSFQKSLNWFCILCCLNNIPNPSTYLIEMQWTFCTLKMFYGRCWNLTVLSKICHSKTAIFMVPVESKVQYLIFGRLRIILIIISRFPVVGGKLALVQLTGLFQLQSVLQRRGTTKWKNQNIVCRKK